MNDLGQKYDFLLHPIKDLTKNWNIDIASVLEDYLGELDKLTFSFDGGKTQLNFAEASFLIQGTACVWSRKVEYLHGLVYQTLQMISSNRQEKQPNSIDANGVDKDDTFDDHEDKFLNLDDERVTSSKGLGCNLNDVVCIPCHSIYLHNLEEDRGTSFLSKNEEVINYYKDFWLNRMTPLMNGMTLIERPFNEEATTSIETNISIPNDDNAAAATVTPVEDDVFESSHPLLDDSIDNHDGDMTVGGDVSCNVNEVVEEAEIRQFRQRAAPIHSEIQTINEEPQSNVMLDPHAECAQWTSKPFQKGKTIRYPPSLALGKKKRKRQNVCTIPLLHEFFQSFKKFSKSGSTDDPIIQEQKRRVVRWKQLRADHSKYKIAKEFFEDEPQDGVALQYGQIDDDADDNNDHWEDNGSVPDLEDLVNDIEENNVPLSNMDASKLDLEQLETYEDLVRHHVEQFYTSAKLYIQETALGHRVKEWQQSIDPFLEEQDQRPEFDIHKYGDHMISHFNEVGEAKRFADVVATEDRWSICRHFAATLQLANDGNFHLGTQSESSVNALQLRLLTQNKLRNRIDDYAPS